MCVFMRVRRSAVGDRVWLMPLCVVVYWLLVNFSQLSRYTWPPAVVFRFLYSWSARAGTFPNSPNFARARTGNIVRVVVVVIIESTTPLLNIPPASLRFVGSTKH